jgi:hypothetical protein
MTFAGIRCRITKEIRVRVTTVTIATVVMAVIIATIGRDTPDQVDAETGMIMMDHGVV